jgi:hypothetical protein
MKVSEPTGVYDTLHLQGLKSRFISSIDNATDKDKLEQYVELLYEDSMPYLFLKQIFM